ncbi:hypothetical protein AB0M02_06920 [Actinoplanes sp. NPDC051861]|uniref:hypothetical protein n=1 Tax=Actinoplanes sp. NPDC051861 TaxID=3155170 RepID=UPI00343CFDB0
MTPEIRLLGAALRGAEQDRDRIMPTAILTAVFVVAARRRFPADVDRRAVTRFARQVRDIVPGGTDFPMRDIEAAVRGVTGEVTLIGGSGSPQLMYATTLALADELELTGSEIDALLSEAEREAASARELAAPPDDEVVPVHRYRRIHRRLLTGTDLRPAREPRPHRTVPSDLHRGRPSTPAGRHLHGSLIPSARTPAPGAVDSTARFRILRATLAGALPRYLPPSPEVHEVAALVRAAQSISTAEVDPMKAEYVARILLLEDLPLDGFTKRDIYQNGAALLQAITAAWNHDDAVFAALIAEAEATLAG